MNESWYIPRATLTGTSTSTSSSSSSNSISNPPTALRDFNGKILPSNKIDGNNEHLDQNKFVGSAKCLNKTSAHSVETIWNNIKNQTKRGSRSSQGSYDSNNSTQSISSGSLLLTAANLERFAAIHRQQNISSMQKTNDFLQSKYASNLMIASSKLNSGKDSVIVIDPNISFIKTKDMDTISVASSTHFTMVNGEGGSMRKTTEGICSRGKQVTVLIISMSLFFLFVIFGMVYALEMRAREMPKS